MAFDLSVDVTRSTVETIQSRTVRRLAVNTFQNNGRTFEIIKVHHERLSTGFSFLKDEVLYIKILYDYLLFPLDMNI